MEYPMVVKNFVAFFLRLLRPKEYGTLTVKIEAGKISHVIWAKSIRPEDFEAERK